MHFQSQNSSLYQFFFYFPYYELSPEDRFPRLMSMKVYNPLKYIDTQILFVGM